MEKFGETPPEDLKIYPGKQRDIPGKADLPPKEETAPFDTVDTEKASEGKEPEIKLTLSEDQKGIIDRQVAVVVKLTRGEKISDEERAGSAENFINLKQEKTFEIMGVNNDYKEKYYNYFVAELPDEIAVKTAENVNAGKNPLIGLSEKEVDAYNKAVKTAREKAENKIFEKLEKEGRKQEYTDEIDRVSQEINKIGMEKINEKLKQPKETETKLTPDQEKKVEKVESAIKKRAEKIGEQADQMPEGKKETFKKLKEFLGSHKKDLAIMAIAGGLTGVGIAYPAAISVLPFLHNAGVALAPHILTAEATQAGWALGGASTIIWRIRNMLRKKKEETETVSEIVGTEEETKAGEETAPESSKAKVEKPGKVEEAEGMKSGEEIPEELKAEIPNIEDQMERIKKELGVEEAGKGEGETEEEFKTPGDIESEIRARKEEMKEEEKKSGEKPEEKMPKGEEGELAESYKKEFEARREKGEDLEAERTKTEERKVEKKETDEAYAESFGKGKKEEVREKERLEKIRQKKDIKTEEEKEFVKRYEEGLGASGEEGAEKKRITTVAIKDFVEFRERSISDEDFVLKNREMVVGILENILPSEKLTSEFKDVAVTDDIVKPEKVAPFANHFCARIYERMRKLKKDKTTLKLRELYEGEGSKYSTGEEKRLINFLVSLGIERDIFKEAEMRNWEDMTADEFLRKIIKIEEIAQTTKLTEKNLSLIFSR